MHRTAKNGHCEKTPNRRIITTIGGIFMSREYTKVSGMKEQIVEMRENGQSLREIAEHFGFKDKYVVKEFLKRERKKERELRNGIEPRRRGRPRNSLVHTEKEKDNEIKRLKMENELLRDFIRAAGRK